MPVLYQRGDAAWRAQVGENSARLAYAYAYFDSTGWGEFTIAAPFMFDVTFVTEPTVSYGYSLDGDQLVDQRFPRAWGGVYRWVQDTRDFYTGAHVFMVVDTVSAALATTAPEPNYNLNHYFTFAGIALKDLPVTTSDLDL